MTTALEAYRATYFVLGAFIVPLNHFVLGVRSVYRRTIRFIAPRLGVLNQHAPRELRLPPSHSRPISLVDAPRISIVTPSFNQAQFIERTIRSVLDQGYPALEYRVQDGGSRDGTVEILRRYEGKLAGWESAPDDGQSQAINRGFTGTTGEIMAWLNSDDVLFPGSLAFVGEFFASHPEVDVIYGHRILIDEDDRQIGRWMLPAHDDAVLSWADFVPQETLFWRRRIWDKVGGRVDESFRFAMDWDLLLRFREAGARFERVPRFLGGFRIHGRQKTSATISDVGFDEMDRLRSRVLGRVPSRNEVNRALIPYLLRHVAIDLRWKLRDGFAPPAARA
jgi:glycosyltransferase involved in cell wall biosynthesis